MKSNFPKKVLVTGAQGALGSEIVEKYLSAGCKVFGTYFTQSKEVPVARESLEWINVDLTDSRWVRTVFGGLGQGGSSSASTYDAWIHCAGGFRFSTVDQLSDEDLDFLLNLNLRSAFYLARELVPGMKKKNFGRIVFISSRVTLGAGVGMAAYAASKAGLNALTAALAEEVKAFDITVNSVLPTVIDTPVNRKDMPKEDFSKWVSPAQLADIIFSLTAPWGKSIHGALIPVSGRV
jgi:NAD(P)-dependent dehydrogenase (short-subunit alcohol dehydrogenase family)